MPREMKLPTPIDGPRKPTHSHATELASIRRLRAEVNLVRFPFFDLARERTQAPRDLIEVQETKRAPDGSKIQTTWRVSRNVTADFPGELARRLHREVVERSISQLPKPVQNPVRLGSFREICSLLEIRYGGKTAKAVHAALKSSVTASIESRTTLYLKAKRRYFDDTFHLYDRVVVTGEPLPDGRIADAVYVVLGSWYLENLNANYVAPLDFDYFRHLAGPVASRMYELLHHWFFIAMKNGRPLIERRYSTLCAYFPLTRQETLWKARQQLRQAHEQHFQSGYLVALPEWRPISGSRKDWTLVYAAGKKAQDEYRRNQSHRDQEGLAPDELSDAQFLLPLPPASIPGPSDLQRDLLRELELRGITRGIALSLIEKHEPTLIQQKVEAFDWQVRKADQSIIKNPAGYLRTSIEQNYAPPEGFVPAAERKRQAADEAARRRAAHDAEARAACDRQQRATAIEARWTALSPADRSSIEARAEASLAPFARQALTRERLEGRQSGTGHFALRAEIEKLLAAELDS